MTTNAIKLKAIKQSVIPKLKVHGCSSRIPDMQDANCCLILINVHFPLSQAQELTGVPVPKYYNPAAVNPLKYAEQVQKRKLLWSKNKKEVSLFLQHRRRHAIWCRYKVTVNRPSGTAFMKYISIIFPLLTC